MKIKVNSADVISYNANNRGSFVGDCVLRALSLAFDQPYREMSKEIKARYGDNYKRNYAVIGFVENKCGSDFISIGLGRNRDYIELNDFVDEHPVGTYLIMVKPDLDKRGGGHIVCAIDGNIYDTWDSRENYVEGYFKIDENKTDRNLKLLTHDEMTSIKENLTEYSNEVVNYYAKKYGTQIDFDRDPTPIYLYSDGNVYSISGRVYFEDDESIYLDFNVSVPMGIESVEKAEKYIKSKIREKIYDRLSVFFKRIQEEKDSADLRRQTQDIGVTEDGTFRSYFNLENKVYWPEKYKRFYNSLPGWSKRLIHNIRMPHWRGGAYSIDILPLPEDPDRQIKRFTGFTSQELKDELISYKESLEG